MNDRAAYNRQYRLQLQREGICTMCASREPGREPRPGLKTCSVCAQRAAERDRGREPRYRPRGTKPGRPLRGVDRFGRPGECSRCTRSVLPGKDVCREHAETLAQIMRERTG